MAQLPTPLGSGNMSRMDVPYPNDGDRLRENIRDELLAQQGMAGPDLDDATVERLADAIATNIDYAFSIRWAPRWVKNGEPHRWTERADGERAEYYVDCVQCRRTSVHRSAEEAEAWYTQHALEAHA